MQPELKNIPLNKIQAESNYRKTFNDRTLRELSQSIKENGVLEPIIVRPGKPGKYEIVAGERRFRASLLAGLVTIPAVVRDVANVEVLKLQIIENVQREGVPFMEEAYALKKLREDLSLDVAEIAKIIGKSDAYVYFMLNLTKMSKDAQEIASKGWISKGVAWQISRLPSTELQTQAANDLARPQRGKLVSENTAKSYIRENFQSDSSGAMRKHRVKEYGASDYAANWKYHLVRFTAAQFKHFQDIVRGRTETAVLSESVDLVIRNGGSE